MKLLLVGILFLLVAVPSVMAHPVIVDTYPPKIISHTHEDDNAKAPGDFIIIVIGIIVITMIITILVVYHEDIILIKKH